ncbi:MAG: hypothetical protein HYY26_05160, partial [Acidobacteria bacterium]|nr:hypothetical protein [Acidobacteriota bacterium]
VWGGVAAVVLGGVVSLPATPRDATEETTEAQVRAATAAAISAESERTLRTAFTHLYNLEFTSALQLFEQIARAEPESATVCSFWASAVLYEMLARQGTLQSQLFVTSNEFLRLQRLPPDPELDRLFHEVSRQAEQRALKRLQANPNDLDALFALGLMYGNQANYLAGVKAEYFQGLRMGEKAFAHHKKVRQLYPEIHDTAIVLGIHDYIIGSLPRTHRFILFFLGTRGSRERGLDYFQEAARQGEYLATYAQVLLVVAHIREARQAQALLLGEDLLARYPRNPIFMLEMARLNRQLERFVQALRLSRELVAELFAHPHNPRLLGPEDGLLELALIEAAQGNLPRALQTLAQIERVPEANSKVIASAALERGKILDRLGQRENALAEYEKVIRLDADAELVNEAKLYRKRPYQR